MFVAYALFVSTLFADVIGDFLGIYQTLGTISLEKGLDFTTNTASFGEECGIYNSFQFHINLLKAYD